MQMPRSQRISHKRVGEPTKFFIVALFCTGINSRLNQEGYSVTTGVTLCSFSSFLCSKYPIQGFTIQDGPLRLKSVWFNSFPPNENRSASAIGFQPSTQWPSFPNNDVQDLQFGFDDGVSMTSLKGADGTLPFILGLRFDFSLKLFKDRSSTLHNV